jgi:hypothetical protein
VCVAEGVTWTSRTTSAPWDARIFHTSVVDAAGAIYVIGGRVNQAATSGLMDVWVSTNGGADRTQSGVLEGALSSQGGTRWVLGVPRGTSWVLSGYSRSYKVYENCTKGISRILEGTRGVLEE